MNQSITHINTKDTLLASNFINPDVHKDSSRENKHLPKHMSNQYTVSKVNDEYHVECEGIDTAVTTIKVGVPIEFYDHLNEIHKIAKRLVKRMLLNREESSTKYYKELHSVISKTLIPKYQKNKKCKSVKNVVLPICGDKGKNIKITEGGVRLPAIFQKVVIPVTFRQPVVGFIRHAELLKKKDKWFLTLAYNTPVLTDLTFTSVIGVDRNSRGNIAVAAHEGGQVRKLGIDAGAYQHNEMRRRAHLQSKGKLQLCKKISGIQARRIKDENHKVSRAVIDFAKTHRSAIVLENLSGVRNNKSGYAKKSNWSYFQLQTFVSYKAALLGIPVFFVDAAYTTKQCSKCGEINSPKGKQFKCIKCDHFDHRDANAAFNIAQRFYESSFGSSVSKVRHIGEPQTIQCHNRLTRCRVRQA